MYQDSKRTCRTIVLLIKSFVCWRSHRHHAKTLDPCQKPRSMQEYATLLPAVYPSMSLFCFNTEHLLQVGNLHLKHLYFVLIKQERHISITLCDASNDFRQDLLLSIVRPFPAPSSPEAAFFWSVVPKGARPLGRECISGHEIVFVQCMLVRGEIAFGRWGSMYFPDVCLVHHIWINCFVICMIYELSSAHV